MRYQSRSSSNSLGESIAKLRGCDVVALKVEDVAPHGYAIDRATIRQKKTGLPVRFEITEHTRQAVDDYIRTAGRKSGDLNVSAPALGATLRGRLRSPFPARRVHLDQRILSVVLPGWARYRLSHKKALRIPLCRLP
jgi:hypothetical protein